MPKKKKKAVGKGTSPTRRTAQTQICQYPTPNWTDMQDFLKAIWLPGEIREVRTFKKYIKSDKESYRPYLQGWFDEPESVIKSIQSANLENCHIYITLNPCNDYERNRHNFGVLAFSQKQYRNEDGAYSEKATKIDTCGSSGSKDEDMKKLRFLLVDLDPEREANTASNKEELRVAFEAAKIISKKLGKPYIYGISGNGYHMIYQHSASEKEQLKNFLQSLDEDLQIELDQIREKQPKLANVKVDCKCFNPSRITKILGSWSIKGDNSKERPYRVSKLSKIYKDAKILSIPSIPLPLEVSAAKTLNGNGISEDFHRNLAVWQSALDNRGYVYKMKSKATSEMLELKDCPWSDEHSSSNEYCSEIYVNHTGVVTFHCHHNHSGETYTIHDVKKKLGISLNGSSGKIHMTQTSLVSTPGKVASFPLGVFPESLQKYVRKLGETSIPVDYAACSFLSVASVLIGTREIEINPGWQEKAILFLSLVGKTGSGKSPAMDKSLEIINEIEEQLQLQNQQAQKQYDDDSILYSADLAQWKQANGKQKGQSLPQKPDKPLNRAILTNDTTIEALIRLLHDNEKGLLIHKDELTAWIHSFNQYRSGKGTDKEFFLSAWNGGKFKLDRRGQNPLFIPRTKVNILGGIVPENLQFLKSPYEDGFFERIIFCYPEEMQRCVTFSTPCQKEVKRLFRAIYQKDREMVYLSQEAKSLFKKYGDDVYKRNANTKLTSYLARFALVLTALHDLDTCDEDTMRKALQLIRYFESHSAKVAMEMQTSIEKKSLNAILKWAERKGKKTILLKRIFKNNVGGCRSKAEAIARLQALVQLGYAVWSSGPEGKQITLQ